MASTSQVDKLRELKRPQLQKLAREHKIKANLKSEVIIDLLLQRFNNERQADGVSCDVQHADPLPPSGDGDNPRDCRRSGRLVAIPTNPSIGRRPPLNLQQPKESVRAAQDRSPSYPESPPDIDYVCKEQLGAPESLVRETVAILAEFDKGDQQLVDRIIEMRKTISNLRSQTQNTRALLRAENARRRRAVQYYLYWHPITSNWSYEEVWSGTVRVRDDDDHIGFTSSDEEDWKEENAESSKGIVTNPPSSHLDDSIISNSVDRTENAVQEAGALFSPVEEPVTKLKTSNTVVGEKRLRLRTSSPDDADGRYAPRRRVEADDLESSKITSERINGNLLKGSNDSSSPQMLHTLKRVDKGKAKMTTEQVEELEREYAVERLLAEVAAEACYNNAGSNLEPTSREEQHDEEGGATLVVQPQDSRKACANLQVDGDVQTINTTEPGQEQKQENGNTSGAENALWPSTFSSASHQPRHVQRTSRKRKREDEQNASSEEH